MVKYSKLNVYAFIIFILAFVVFAAANFSVTVNPSSATTGQGKSVQTRVSLAQLENGTTPNISLSYAGCPPESFCSFNQSTGSVPFSTNFTVATNFLTPLDNYTIVITAVDQDGVTNSSNYLLRVLDTQPSILSINANPSSGPAPLTVNFQSSVLGGEYPLTYLWNFGDGNTSGVQFPTYIFSQVGGYNVMLAVTDFDGDAANRSVFVNVTVPAEPHVYFSDDVEGGAGEWNASGLWHITTNMSSSLTHSWGYGNETTGNYVKKNNAGTSIRNAGNLISAFVNLTGAVSPKLSFKNYWNTEAGTYYDTKKVFVSTNNGATWTQLLQISTNPRVWQESTVNLNNYIGSTIRIRFEFDTKDGLYNNYPGWFIDDVKVYQ